MINTQVFVIVVAGSVENKFVVPTRYLQSYPRHKKYTIPANLSVSFTFDWEMKLAVFAVIASLVAVSASVQVLNNDNFQESISSINDGKVWFVKFYAPW